MPIHRRAMLKTSLAGLGALAASSAWPTAHADEPKAAGRLLVHTAPAPNQAKAGFGFSGLVTINPEDATWRKVADGGTYSRLSPDGKRFAMGSVAGQAKGQLVVGELDGAEPPRSVAEFEGRVFTPVWSADGKSFLVTVGGRGEDGIPTAQVFRLAADGTGVEPLTFTDKTFVTDWSPDDQHVLAQLIDYPAGQPPTAAKISQALLRPDGSIVRRLTERGGAFARFSPDGRRILHDERADDGHALWIQPIEGGERRRIPVKELRMIQACWSPDGKSIAIGSDSLERGPGGRLMMPIHEPLVSEIAIVEVDGDARRTLPLPGGRLQLNDWR
jgi:Tol biopolymer transport system component